MAEKKSYNQPETSLEKEHQTTNEKRKWKPLILQKNDESLRLLMNRKNQLKTKKSIVWSKAKSNIPVSLHGAALTQLSLFLTPNTKVLWSCRKFFDDFYDTCYFNFWAVRLGLTLLFTTLQYRWHLQYHSMTDFTVRCGTALTTALDQMEKDCLNNLFFLRNIPIQVIAPDFSFFLELLGQKIFSQPNTSWPKETSSKNGTEHAPEKDDSSIDSGTENKTKASLKIRLFRRGIKPSSSSVTRESDTIPCNALFLEISAEAFEALRSWPQERRLAFIHWQFPSNGVLGRMLQFRRPDCHAFRKSGVVWTWKSIPNANQWMDHLDV